MNFIYKNKGSNKLIVKLIIWQSKWNWIKKIIILIKLKWYREWTWCKKLRNIKSLIKNRFRF